LVEISAPSLQYQTELQQTFILSNEKQYLPLSEFVSLGTATDYKYLNAGSSGEFLPLKLHNYSGSISEFETKTHKVLAQFPELSVSFGGTIYTTQKLLGELGKVLIISVLLLYFILAAQFDSLILPLLILIEIPIDIAAAGFALWAFGSSLNVMSAIGMVVMSGIIINDSILKIDVINRLMKYEGMNMEDAMHEGGKRRFRSIVMTSMTTILALAPLFFSTGLGNELQKPLAITLIVGLLVGLPVSLYLVPYLYKLLRKFS